MKVSVGQVVKSWDVLKKLTQLEGLDAKTTYGFIKGLRKVEHVMNDYEKARVAAIKKYGADDGKGMFKVKPDMEPVFEKELADLWKEEAELPGKFKVPGAATGLTPADMLSLEDFVEVV